MKIFISLDMEGVAGTFDWKQEKNGNVVENCMFQQMEWIIEGIKKSSVNDEISEIVIADSHGMGSNLPYSFTSMDRRISLISGRPRPYFMMSGLDDTFDMVFFVGYHAGAGSLNGVMNHTYAGRIIHNVWINDILANESLLNGAFAGYYNVPVVLIVGDDILYKDLQKENGMPWVNYVVAKEGLATYASKLKSIDVVKEETIKAVQDTLSKNPKDIPVYKFDSPVKLKIEFANVAMADAACLMPYVKRISGRIIEFTHDDYKVVFDALTALIVLAS